MEGRRRYRDPEKQAAFEAKQAAEAARAAEEKPVSEVRQRARDRIAAEQLQSNADAEAKQAQIVEEKLKIAEEATEAGYKLGEKRLNDIKEFSELSDDIDALLKDEADYEYLLNIAPGEMPVGDSALIREVLQQAAREDGPVNYAEIAQRFLAADLDLIQESIDVIKHDGITIEDIRLMKELEGVLASRFSVDSLKEQVA